MAEFHPDAGLSKHDYYRLAKQRVNSKFDNQLREKSIFTSIKSIEQERAKELEKVEIEYFGRRSGGFFGE